MSPEIEEVGEFGPDSIAPGTPVFEVENEHGSMITVAFLPDYVEDADARVFHAFSSRKGDFSRLLNHVGGVWYPGEAFDVVFSNVVTEAFEGRNLDDVLDGFERRTVEAENGPHAGEEYDELVGTWDPERAEGDA